MFSLNKKNVQIISLGQNCIPRTILTRNGIKPKKIQGEKSYPFDIAIFGNKEITKLLSNNFSEFFYDLNYNEDENIWAKTPNCIKFTHEKNIRKNDKEKLIKIYQNRINNFQKAIRNKKPILFVQIIEECEDVENLYKEIKNLRENNPFILVIIDTQDIVKNVENSDIQILKLNFPSKEYKNNWWKKEYYNSKEGKLFEKTISDFCKSCIKKLEEKVIN